MKLRVSFLALLSLLLVQCVAPSGSISFDGKTVSIGITGNLPAGRGFAK